MSDGNRSEDEPRQPEGTGSLAERIESQAKAVRGTADLLARSVCQDEPPSWGSVVGWLDSWSQAMHGWSQEVRELTAKTEF